MLRIRSLFAVAVLASVLTHTAPSRAETIIDEWQNVKPPPAPELKAVTIDSKTSALLVMDLLKQTCNNDRRPRCVASIPKIKDLIAAGRAQNTMLIYTTVPPIPITDTLPAVAPNGNDPVVVSWVDKFVRGNEDRP